MRKDHIIRERVLVSRGSLNPSVDGITSTTQHFFSVDTCQNDIGTSVNMVPMLYLYHLINADSMLKSNAETTLNEG